MNMKCICVMIIISIVSAYGCGDPYLRNRITKNDDMRATSAFVETEEQRIKRVRLEKEAEAKQEQETYITTHPELDGEIKDAIHKGQIITGMNLEQAQIASNCYSASSFDPKKTYYWRLSSRDSSSSEIWEIGYSDYGFRAISTFYFQHGKIISWTEWGN